VLAGVDGGHELVEHERGEDHPGQVGSGFEIVGREFVHG
jgi:hypothetical protein